MTRFLKVSPRLPVRDLARAVTFYREMLGFHAGQPWPAEAPTFVMLERDGVVLQFYVPQPLEPTGHGTINLEVDDVRPLHKALKDRLTIDWGPEVYWYRRREFSFRDPDGYTVVISAETDDPVDCAAD